MDISLIKWSSEFADDLAAQANNINVSNNLRDAFPSPYSLADAEDFIVSCIANDGRNQLVRAILLNGRAIGCISVSLCQDIYRKSAELGYFLGEGYWGRGIMTRAVSLICREAFERFDIVRIYAEPFAENIGSRRVLEKNGFVLEGTMKMGAYKNGRFLDYCVYGLLKSPYGEVRQ